MLRKISTIRRSIHHEVRRDILPYLWVWSGITAVLNNRQKKFSRRKWDMEDEWDEDEIIYADKKVGHFLAPLSGPRQVKLAYKRPLLNLVTWSSFFAGREAEGNSRSDIKRKSQPQPTIETKAYNTRWSAEKFPFVFSISFSNISRLLSKPLPKRTYLCWRMQMKFLVLFMRKTLSVVWVNHYNKRSSRIPLQDFKAVPRVNLPR